MVPGCGSHHGSGSHATRVMRGFFQPGDVPRVEQTLIAAANPAVDPGWAIGVAVTEMIYGVDLELRHAIAVQVQRRGNNIGRNAVDRRCRHVHPHRVLQEIFDDLPRRGPCPRSLSGG